MTSLPFVFHALRAPPPAPLIADPADVSRRYAHMRLRTMYAMFIGYAVFYFVRKNLSAATPALIADLGYSKTQIGLLWSGLYLAYGVSKFANGVLGDRANARFFMPIGLLLSALANLLFGLSSSIVVLAVFWVLNGWAQGMGWPPCARLLTSWYSPNERGTKWAIWNTSHQVGGGLILVLAGWLTQQYGWRSSFYVPAAIAVVCSVFLVNRLRDTPESLGLPSIEKFRRDETGTAEQAATAGQSAYDILFGRVLRSRQLWFLAFSNFFVYLVRYGAMDWAPTFLVEVKHSSLTAASAKTALFELLGIGGAMLAGWLSDRWFRDRRYLVNVGYMVALTFAVVEFWLVPPGHPWLDALALSGVGFLVYGPQMMVGVCAADAGGRYAAATATGFTGLFGYLGSIASGVGTGWVVDRYGWDGGFLVLIGAAVLGALFFLATSGPKQAARVVPAEASVRASPPLAAEAALSPRPGGAPSQTVSGVGFK